MPAQVRGELPARAEALHDWAQEPVLRQAVSVA
jgi:hypothetical protein